MDVPFFLCCVPAGFPSPADDFKESALDLHELLIAHPDATFYVRVRGDSMKNAGIRDGDILVVDRALEARPNSIIVARLHQEFTVKRLSQQGESVFLVPANPQYRPIRITPEMDFQVWGVVRAVIHLFVPRGR